MLRKKLGEKELGGIKIHFANFRLSKRSLETYSRAGAVPRPYDVPMNMQQVDGLRCIKRQRLAAFLQSDCAQTLSHV
jgi:hypothetical protein